MPWPPKWKPLCENDDCSSAVSFVHFRKKSRTRGGREFSQRTTFHASAYGDDTAAGRDERAAAVADGSANQLHAETEAKAHAQAAEVTSAEAAAPKVAVPAEAATGKVMATAKSAAAAKAMTAA